MAAYTIGAFGEERSATPIELTDDELAVVVRVFTAINDTAERDNDYSPSLDLFPGVLSKEDMRSRFSKFPSMLGVAPTEEK